MPGIEINICDDTGMTKPQPIHRYCSLRCITWIANITIRTNTIGRTPLYCAVRFGYVSPRSLEDCYTNLDSVPELKQSTTTDFLSGCQLSLPCFDTLHCRSLSDLQRQANIDVLVAAGADSSFDGVSALRVQQLFMYQLYHMCGSLWHAPFSDDFTTCPQDTEDNDVNTTAEQSRYDKLILDVNSCLIMCIAAPCVCLYQHCHNQAPTSRILTFDMMHFRVLTMRHRFVVGRRSSQKIRRRGRLSGMAAQESKQKIR